jgi:hypothetical protein
MLLMYNHYNYEINNNIKQFTKRKTKQYKTHQINTIIMLNIMKTPKIRKHRRSFT